MSSFEFTLYVAGQTSRSARAEDDLHRLCDGRLPVGGFEITVVDVLRDTEQAEVAHIIVIPTVIRTDTLPTRRVMGDLSAGAKVAAALQLPLELVGPPLDE